MKVPSLQLYSFYVVTDKEGKETEYLADIETGCYQMCDLLEKKYGIKTVPSTVFRGTKKFIPTRFPKGRDKEYYMAYLNWALNYPRHSRCYYFDDELDKKKYYENNPFVSLHIKVKKKLEESQNIDL